MATIQTKFDIGQTVSVASDQRMKRLETAFDRLCDALKRRGTEQDGNWGHPPFNTELELIRQYAAGMLD